MLSFLRQRGQWPLFPATVRLFSVDSDSSSACNSSYFECPVDPPKLKHVVMARRGECSLTLQRDGAYTRACPEALNRVRSPGPVNPIEEFWRNE
jgi:hypothetical protein